MKESKRATIFRVSRFQRAFFYPVVVAFSLGCVVSWLSLVYFLIEPPHFINPKLGQFQDAIPVLLSLIVVLTVVVIFWTLRISNKYLGSYDRIVEDFDKILEGEKRGPLETRKGDVVFEGLLKRINTLIAKK